MAKYTIGDNITILDGPDGIVYITRPSMITNKINTVPFTNVTSQDLVFWIAGRAQGLGVAMVQDAFPQLNDSEREFLLTGITEEEWKEHMTVEEEEKGND